ncbi:MAG: hypothetical protein H6741_24150 [Alphaproteobacteria bacterium]|nr:hypothetical protein [Alphaproteobacteria bacterium]
MRTRWITALVLLGSQLVGCQSIEGVWHVYRAWEPIPDDACVDEITHNFTNLYTPEEETTEDPWTYSEVEERSDAEFFGTLFKSGDEYVFIVGNTIYEGVKQADGTYLFSADSYTQSTDGQTHSTGYMYRELEDSSAGFSMHVTFEGKALFNGTLDTEYVSMITWDESDNWSQELAETEIGNQGQIPSQNYFLREIEGNVVPAFNQFDRADCTSDPCTITVTTSCSYGYSVTGHRTDLEWDDYEATGGAGQGAGYQGP